VKDIQTQSKAALYIDVLKVKLPEKLWFGLFASGHLPDRSHSIFTMR
jgi:hypothetical protein